MSWYRSDLQVKSAVQTGTAALSYSFVGENSAFGIVEVRMRLSDGAGTDQNGASGDFTIRLDSANGQDYDVLLFSQDMTSSANVVYRPDDSTFQTFELGDKVTFAYANAGGATYGLEIKYVLM